MVQNTSILEKFKEFLTLYPLTANQQENSVRKIVNLNEIRKFDRELAEMIINDPVSAIPLMEDEAQVRLGFTGSLLSHNLTPRTISSFFISKLISVEGIITSVSAVRPKIKKSVHYDGIKKIFYERDYRDSTMIESGSSKLPVTDTVFPTQHENRPLQAEYGLSTYSNFQTAVLQEMPEKTPAGQLPRSIECVFADDLVDLVRPGDRVKAVGVFKAIVGIHKGLEVPSKFRTILIANNIIAFKTNKSFLCKSSEKESLDLEGLDLAIDRTGEIMKNIKLLSESSLKYKLIAPSIFGHSDIKKALALQMVGGNEIVMSNGSRIRGDINILLIGDPSTGKSQLLRFIYSFSELAIITTGRGSSGVGLTAAVIMDKDTGEKRLEAGAMVLADRGICCIDEFDKLSEEDRVAIHEVMEQQTISISKAGIHTTLNARCSVLAAANPFYGTYDRSLSVRENIRLPSSLLSRFDLVFITLDGYSIYSDLSLQGAELDRHICDHILNSHVEDPKDDELSSISPELLKKFFSFAKTFSPKLSAEASEYICNAYAEIRKNRTEKKSELVISVTPRLLETIIRIATAFAKLRLSSVVELSDAEDAVRFVNDHKSVPVIDRFHTVARDLETKPFATKEKKVVFEDTLDICKENIPEENLTGETLMRDTILEAIWNFKDKNGDVGMCSFETLANETNIPIKDIIAVSKELSAQDIVMIDSNNIYFLD